jgi:ElaB/YqjD/DUF883 family membrane-anchored ribosome-binding protein
MDDNSKELIFLSDDLLKSIAEGDENEISKIRKLAQQELKERKKIKRRSSYLFYN